MKTDMIIAGWLAMVVLGNCTSPRYLPSVDKIDIARHGSRITIYRDSGPNVRGELISADAEKVIVLTDTNSAKRVTDYITLVPSNEINNFKLTYARPKKKFGWTIPVFTLASCSHGFYGIFTLPVNLAVTLSIAASSTRSLQYYETDIKFNDLKMFARFPQGIPPGIDVGSLK